MQIVGLNKSYLIFSALPVVTRLPQWPVFLRTGWEEPAVFRLLVRFPKKWTDSLLDLHFMALVCFVVYLLVDDGNACNGSDNGSSDNVNDANKSNE